VAVVAGGIVPDPDGVGVDVVGDVVELLHAITANANMTPPRVAKRIAPSKGVPSQDPCQ
jgi:hypothetical protein